jgi:hypothetical protein
MEALPTRAEIEDDLAAALESIIDAQDLRRRLRRRTRRRDPERQKQIDRRVTSLEGNGSVLRSHLKRSDHHSIAYSAAQRRRIKKLLAKARYERRQLRKMLP